MNHNKVLKWIALSLLFLELTYFSVIDCQNLVSQISPKSIVNDDEQFEHNIQPSETINNIISFDDETMKISPSLHVFNEEESTIKEINEIESNNIEVESSGRYHESIRPTLTYNKIENIKSLNQEITEDGNFLVKGGRRARSSRPQNEKMDTVLPMKNVNSNDFAVSRQNNDIQGIISGIVKLLNGNVNVHSNNQGTRRPPSNRINNRGPPRIAEAQVPGNEIQEINNVKQQQSFGEAPLIRPFLTGVPIPEQIVPSMQQNFRPGFISQNRPPWKRTKPPISRRPAPQYTHHHIPTHYVSDEIINNSNVLDKEKPIEDDDDDTEVDTVIEEDTLPPPLTNVEEKTDIASTLANENISSTVITIIQSTSEINTVAEQSNDIFSTLVDDDMNKTSLSIELEPSTNEILPQIPVTFTPTLIDTSTTTSILSSVNNYESVIRTTETSNPTTKTHQTQFIPRPGVVLDDPEFNAAQKGNHHHYNQRQRIQPQQASLPPGYGEIFDVTLSAVQFGGDSHVGSHQTINIKPYNAGYEGTDIILSPSGDQGFVSIDGKRTYINLFGESTDQAPRIEPTQMVKDQIRPTNVHQPNGVTGSAYVSVVDPEPVTRKPVQHHQNSYLQNQNRLVLKPKVPPQLPPVRIDTCIVGDDSTCDKAQNEKCMNDNGVSSCSCKQGYARRKHRDICRKIVSVVVSMRVDRYNDRKIVWDSSLNDFTSEPFRSLKYESLRAIDSAMSMTPFSDEFMEATVNNVYQGDASKGMAGVFVNLTLMIEENGETIRPAIKNDIQRHLLGVIHRRNNNIGNSALYVDSAPGSVSAVVDLNECEVNDLNDCHAEATCTNIWGSYTCQCNSGLKDLDVNNPQRAGRECMSCDSSHCNNRGTCSFDSSGAQSCTCSGFYYGSACEIDGEILFVSIGASVAAIFIIILTLICLVMWSRKWQRAHKNAMVGSPLFGYMGNAQVKAPIMGTVPYQMTLEDRMRWAQIADVMAQSNHYGAEPSRTLPTIYSGYPNLNGMMSGMTLPHNNHHTLHTAPLPPPPVPLPRLGINRPNGMRNLENSSSSEEEDRTDLLGRSFQVPRPKSRAASVTSAIYYDVDYSPEQDYGGHNSTSNQIPLSTYSARPHSTTYYK